MARRRPLVPEAREALDRMKIEFANELGIQLSRKDQGNKPAKLNAAIGGPIGGMSTRKAVEDFEKKLIGKE